MPGFARRHRIQIEFNTEIALRAHLDGGTRQTRCTHVLNRDDAIRFHDFETCFQQQLFSERIADLHGRTLLCRVIIEFGRRHGRAVNAVAAGLGTEINDRHVHTGRRCVKNLVGLSEAHRHRVDQNVAVVARVKARLPADRRNTK